MAKRLLALLAASTLLAGCASLAPRQLAQDRMNDACKSKIASKTKPASKSSKSKAIAKSKPVSKSKIASKSSKTRYRHS